MTSLATTQPWWYLIFLHRLDNIDPFPETPAGPPLSSQHFCLCPQHFQPQGGNHPLDQYVDQDNGHDLGHDYDRVHDLNHDSDADHDHW